ncbi:dicarboxylate/amino acid:cation symporter [Methylovirgula ligni]|uniref:Aerobic C4-dicarboxylate transport protein n=1 Tax=Methylovirgula ligni TaxID=569860 RepID=A0A3D9Z222_9HYPH|nr:C4-dicarboxylate transporter DctA [Methylovirgula ligni]QAY96906.1 dicarboxylate/amino acid:cation symporter [Methylovirgula ligni]REF88040.1 aerobic C4-dicarboxylate transport protein [Methylovirgula ligni]
MDAPAPAKSRPPFYKQLYIQVLFAIFLGALFGWLAPHAATADWVKALGDGFVKLIKMVIAPIIFLTVTAGLAHISDARKVGRVALKALVYFEVVSTLALAIGLIIGNLIRPGAGLAAHANAAAVAKYVTAASGEHPVEYLLNIIPDSVVGAFARGDILQVLLFSILFGFALLALGERGKTLSDVLDQATKAIFGVIEIAMRAAPLGAFGAMAFTVGKYGAQALGALAGEIATFYLTSALFIIFVLGGIARFAGFNIFKFLAYLKDELLIVLGTSSSESALPRLIEKLEALGCSRSVVGLVVPAGYSFNLDGTNIYMTLATLFIAHALGFDLTLGQQLSILIVAMLTSKGATGVTGAGFITLAATLSTVSPALVPGMAILLGIDKFMSECRAITNFIGNGVATVVISASEGELDRAKLNAALDAGRRDPAEASLKLAMAEAESPREP